jgi:hypothetical protein
MPFLKRLLVGTAAVAAGLDLAGAASAQSATGSVGVTGAVTTKCAVITGGAGTSFTGTIGLGQLNAANGTIATTFSNSTVTAAAGALTFQINCNGSDAAVDLRATRLSTSGTAVAGYSNNIDYSAALTASLAAGSTKTFTYTTAPTLPADTTGTLGGRLANGTGNITVSIYGLAPENGLTSLLAAGNYASTITVSVTPST